MMKPQRTLSILIIEDNEIEAVLIREHLREVGMETTAAENLKEAKTILTGEKAFDAILLDLTLPDSEGVVTFQKILFYASKIPIIILTGNDDENIIKDALQSGAQDYLLKKNINGDVLKRAIIYGIERKHIELKLKEAIDLNQKIFSAAAFGILTYKSSGECIFANEVASKIINLPLEKMLSQNFHEIKSWKNCDLYSTACEVLSTGIPCNKEINFVSTSGKSLCVNFYFATFYNSGELHLLLILNDNTGKNIIAQDLEWKNYLMDMFMQHIPNAVYFKDTQGRFTAVSKAMADKFGFSDPKELIGKSDFDLFSQEHANQASFDEKSIIQTGIGLYNFEERETYSDKPDSWVISSKMPLIDSTGKISGTFGISGDITEWKKTEQDLIKSRTQLTEAMDVAQLYLWEYDTAHGFVVFNDKFCSFLGIKNSGQFSCSIPLDYFIGNHVHPEDQSIVRNEIELAKSSNDPAYFSQFEYRIVVSDEKSRHFVARLRVETGLQDIPVRLFGIMQDITERKLAIEESLETLNKLDSIKTEFLTFISHEIRTPLNRIVGAINLLKNQEYTSAIQTLVELIDKSVYNLEVFTENASFYSKLSNNYKPEQSYISLKELIQFALLENENMLQEKNLKILLDIPPQQPLIFADKELLFKVVSNILHIFSAISEKNHAIHILVSEAGNQVRCEFSDKAGILPDHLLNSSPEVPGLHQHQIGFSFYIIRQIIDLHKGSLKIFNSEEKGATIVFSLKV